jgi:hypothetical protein
MNNNHIQNNKFKIHKNRINQTIQKNQTIQVKLNLQIKQIKNQIPNLLQIQHIHPE